MKGNTQEAVKIPQLSFGRQQLIKFGHILKKEISRWYEVNLKDEAIDYYTTQTSNKIKGRITFRHIYEIKLQTTTSHTTGKCKKDKQQLQCVEIELNNKRIVYLVQPDKQRLEQLANILNFYKREYKIQSLNTFVKLDAQRNCSENNSKFDICVQSRIREQTNEIELVQAAIPSDFSFYIQLMPESVSQRSIPMNKQTLVGEEGNHPAENNNGRNRKSEDNNTNSRLLNSIKKNSLKQNSFPKQILVNEDDDFAKRQRNGKENKKQTDQKLHDLVINHCEPIKEGLEAKCMQLNDEITEVLSREETENTNRAEIFSKLVTQNDNFQVQKIKKQIQSSSNNLLKAIATQESMQDLTYAKSNANSNNYNNCYQLNQSNQDQYRISTIPSPQSQLIKNPFSNHQQPLQQINFSYKQLPTLPQTTTALGNSFHANSIRFNTLLDSNRDNEQQFTYPYNDDQDYIAAPHPSQIEKEYNLLNITQSSPSHEEDQPLYLSSTIRQRIQNQCSTFKQEKQEEQKIQFAEAASSEINHRQSESEIECESNLASIKQLTCDIKTKHLLKESMTYELQNQFKRQSYFFQEFNTLITMNTQYLGGSTLINNKIFNHGLTLNKRDSLLTYKNCRSQTLDDKSDHNAISQTPKKRDLFLQGSITSRTRGGQTNGANSLRYQFSNDMETQNQGGLTFNPILENNDGLSDDQFMSSAKDVDKVTDLFDCQSHIIKTANQFQSASQLQKIESPKRFPRQSNFNAGYMRVEKRDSESINSKNFQLTSQNIVQNAESAEQKMIKSSNTDKFLMTRLNQIPIEVYFRSKFQSDNNLLIDFDSESIQHNQENYKEEEKAKELQEEENQANASYNMLQIQKVSLVTKTKSDQDSQPALSNREHQYSNLCSPKTPNKKEPQINNQFDFSQPEKNTLNVNSGVQHIPNLNQSFILQQNSVLYTNNFTNTPMKTDNNYLFSPSQHHKYHNVDAQSFNPSLDISKKDPSVQSLKTLNFSKFNIEKALRFVWEFQFSKAGCIFDEFNNQQDISMISGHIYMLLIQFLSSLNTEYAETVCKLCEKGIDLIMAHREKDNPYLLLVQEMHLTEMYLIKGILQFSLDKKIQGLFSLKNAYKYYQKCISYPQTTIQSLKRSHKNKIELLEGINHIAKSTLQDSFRRVLSFFGQTFDLEKGLKLLYKVASFLGEQQQQDSFQCTLDFKISGKIDAKYQDYITKTHDQDDSTFISHIATIFLTLYYVWREKNPTPVVKLINTKLKYFPQSPIYCWLSYLIYYERKDNIKAINDINRALSKTNSFKSQCLSFKFEKSLFLTSNLQWSEAQSLLSLIGVQLLTNEEFKYDSFREILSKAKIKTNHFISFYRSHVIDYKPEKYFFIGISNLLLTQAACLISLQNIDFAKEWLLLSSYFKKHSYLSGFMNNDLHSLSQIYLRRKNFVFVKYEIMYFTKTITKLPNELIGFILSEIEEEKVKISKNDKILTLDEQKQQGVEYSSYIFLRILCGCLLFDHKIIQEGEQELEKIIKYQNDKHYSDFSYLHHHSYYWICKFYFLQQQYDKVHKNIKNMQKYPSKLLNLSLQAETLVKQMQSQENEKNLLKNKNKK